MIKIGDRVLVVRSHIGNNPEWATVISILPAIGDRVAMYRIRLEKEITAPTLTPNPNECWVDEGMVYGLATESSENLVFLGHKYEVRVLQEGTDSEQLIIFKRQKNADGVWVREWGKPLTLDG